MKKVTEEEALHGRFPEGRQPQRGASHGGNEGYLHAYRAQADVHMWLRV